MDIVKQTREVWAKWKYSRNILDKSRYNNKRKLAEIRTDNFKDYLNSLSPYDKSIWKATKHLNNPKHVSHTCLTNQGSRYEKMWKRRSCSHSTTWDLQTSFWGRRQDVNELVNLPIQISFLISKFIFKELLTELKWSSFNKSPRQDLITTAKLSRCKQKN